MTPNTQRIVLNSLLRPNLGYRQVYVAGQPWSYSQQGDFKIAYRSGADVVTVGPNTDFPDGRLVKRQWNLRRNLIILMCNGQSNTVGATSDLAAYNGPVSPFMQQAPIPNVLQAFAGGFTPTQDGVNSDGVTTIIDPAQYEGALVPGKENINTGRTPGKDVNRQTWSSAFGQVIANAVTPDNVVLVVNVGHGSTTFAEDVESAVLLSTATWLAGVATFVFVGPTNLSAGDQFEIRGSSPSAWNGIYTALTSDGINVTATLVSDPGAYVGSGFGLVASPPMVNLRTMLRYAVNTIAPALGLTPYLAAFGYNGNESADTTAAPANFLTMFATLRKYVDEFQAIAGNAVPCEIVWPQVGWPVSAWQASSSLLNCASVVAQTIVDVALVPANHCITYPQYTSVAGGNGDSNAVGCIHYGVQGHSDNGERGANLFLNKMIGDGPYDPPRLLSGDDVLVRVANSTTVTGTFSESTVVDTTAKVTDPGNRGFQFFAGVTNYGGNELGVAVSSVSDAPGTAFSMTLDAVPATAYGNYVGYAYNNATQYAEANNTPITNATWAATGGGQATYTTSVPHGLSPGDTVTIAQMNPSGYNVIPGVAALAGTTGSTIVMPVAVDPGAFVSGGSVAINGAFGIGRVQGLRGQRRAATGTMNSPSTGAPLPRFNVIQFAPVDVYASTRDIAAALVEVGLASSFQGVFDFASSACYTGSGTSVVNQGTSGATNNYTLGDGGLRLPSFVGSANSFNRDTGFFSTGSAEINPAGTPDLLTTAHQANAQFTILFGGYLPASLAQNNYIVATAQSEAAGTAAGVAVRIASNLAWVTRVTDASNGTVFSTNGGSFAANSFYLGGVGIDAANATGNRSWTYNANSVSKFTNFNATYTSPSAGAAQSKMTMMVNGQTGTRYFLNGHGLGFVLVSNSFLTPTVVLPLIRTLYRRQLQNLP